MSKSRDVRDSLIPQDIHVRKITADLQRQIDRRLLQLQRDVAGLVNRHGLSDNPKVPNRTKVAAFEKEARDLVYAAYDEIEQLSDNFLRRYTALEATAIRKILEENVE